MNNLPLVSICIPTYNAAEFLEPCLQSALAQTYPNLEIMISDDGSTDDTLNIIKKYQQQYSHIRVMQNESKGMVNNWNNCIIQARGEWVKFLFQDDILKPPCVKKMLETCLAHHVEIGFCSREFIIHDTVPKPVRNNFRYRMILPDRVFGNTSYISPQRLANEVGTLMPDNVLGEPPCYFFHKKIFEHTAMFNPDYRHAVDLEFIIRLGLIKGLAFIFEPLVQFRVHGKSESSANLNQEKEAGIKNIAAIAGDTMLLYHHFLRDPAFALIKAAMGEEMLQLHINYIYYSGCKHKGRSLFNKALAPIREKYKELGNMNYSFLKYVRYRKLFRQWEKENK
ncbi:MAG TPA: glycosyltransferase [Flavisolibacter sp.]|jgi:glycosyltransferase involved in cell wall biosynthesis|nr:glycosyltransferase [Flavisolibacter sp.]